MRLRRLKRPELPVDTTELARYLIGKIIVHDHPFGRIAARIVETEAYPLGDASSHAFRRQTERNRVMYLQRGRAYVYFTYGSCYCLNVTSEVADAGAAVLIRAAEPLEGIELMERFRETSRALDLARGPGRLCEAFDIDLRLNGVDLCAPGELWLADGAPRDTGVSVRIGITREAHRPLRFYERGNRYVSGPRKLSPAME